MRESQWGNIYQQFLLFIRQSASCSRILVILWLNLPRRTWGEADNISIIFLILKDQTFPVLSDIRNGARQVWIWGTLVLWWWWWWWLHSGWSLVVRVKLLSLFSPAGSLAWWGDWGEGRDTTDWRQTEAERSDTTSGHTGTLNISISRTATSFTTFSTTFSSPSKFHKEYNPSPFQSFVWL